MGIKRKLPHLGNAGSALPNLRGDSGASGAGIHASAFDRKTGGIYDYFQQLSDRLRRVRVACGDWSRVIGDSVTFRHGVTGIFLDPPYSGDYNQEYAVKSEGVALDVMRWAIANGDNPLMRIALCGYDGEYDMPDTWEVVAWKAVGGYGSQGTGQGRYNANKERIWFSPHCIKQTKQQSLAL
jgi:hypothetical protein